MENKKLEQNKREKPKSLLTKSLLIGFVGGILWSSLGAIASYFNFTTVSPATFILHSWLDTPWSKGWSGELIAIFAIGLISIAVAFVYYLLFKKMVNIWQSAMFGGALWFVVFYLLNPIFWNVDKMTELSSNTIVTTICLYLLYGTFIGYSISYEYNDSQAQSS
ncbi:YqhR family membrane protein [Radiobacillus deserti]|uniref:Uncharacterized protein n=1 Tax=Radiobacillus deserti TaxID=2594883 RepID=A0A516KGP5_9BACI|nr:YqhR family membrane protein [Radiobacillus deserti]QDP40578.1 hypothetical protein FN924_10485 [Radiobacillus deserti]